MPVGVSNHQSSRTLVIGVIVAAVFMTNLDLWIVNVALPSIGASYAGSHGATSLSNLSWVLNAYAVALAALLIAAGRLGDRIGHRRVFLIGVSLFTVASAACAAAPNLGWLVAARAVQAAGAAAQLPTSLALLMASVPAAKRATTARSWAAVGGLAAASGPVIGGLLIELSWRWVFVVNLPIGIASLIIGLRLLPHPPAREREPWPDLLGAALVTIAVAAVTGALVEAPTWGWTAPATLGLLFVAVIAGAGFIKRCARHRYPLLELSLFRVRQFSLANIAVFVFSVAFGIMLLSNVLWCQEVWHYSALRTGFAMVPGPFLVPIVTILTVRAMQRHGTGRLAAAGSLVFAGAMLWRVATADVQPNYLRDLLPSMLLGGTGVGLALGTLIAAGVTSLPSDRSATGSAVVNAGRQVAGAVGVALLVTLLGTHVDGSSVGDFKASWWLAAALSIGACGVALSLRHTRVATTGEPDHVAAEPAVG
jgi:EmrB/QacA subfamily drug resistance transporter